MKINKIFKKSVKNIHSGGGILKGYKTSLVVQLVKNVLVMQETLVWSLGWEGSLEN